MILVLICAIGALAIVAAEAANHAIQLNSPASFPVDI